MVFEWLTQGVGLNREIWGQKMIERALRAAGLALIFVVPAVPAMATIYNVPIDVTGQFYDGASLTGVFSLNQYGYANSIFSFTVGAGHSLNGTPIPGYTFSSTGGATLGDFGAPNSYEILTQTGTTNDQLYITFQNALNIPGNDPFVIYTDTLTSSPSLSGQCDGFSCTISDERLLASGYAYVDPPASVPEPLTLSIFGAGLASVAAIRRRKKSKQT